LEIDWDYISGTASGGTAVTGYELQVDDGAGGSFTSAVGGGATPYTLNSVLITSSITSGATYRAIYRAQNVLGWGPFSAIGTVTAAGTPTTPGSPTTSISGTGVVISWTAPSSTGGSGIALTSYKVEVLSSDGYTYY
jgi:hypothetical protein